MRKRRKRRDGVENAGSWMDEQYPDGSTYDRSGGGERYDIHLDESPVSAQGTHWIDDAGKQRLETDTDPAEIIRLLGGGD